MYSEESDYGYLKHRLGPFFESITIADYPRFSVQHYCACNFNIHELTNTVSSKHRRRFHKRKVLTLIWSTILRIWGSKPMSNIRSASSSTRQVQRRRLVFPASRKSIRRPGVAMQISTPLRGQTIFIERKPLTIPAQLIRKYTKLLLLHLSRNRVENHSSIHHFSTRHDQKRGI